MLNPADRERLFMHSIPHHGQWFQDAIQVITTKTNAPAPPQPSGGNAPLRQVEVSVGDSEHLEDMEQSVRSCIMPDTEVVLQWADVSAPERAKLESCIILPITQCRVSNRRFEAILLHGAPGNGKTSLVQSVSRLANIRSFQVDPGHVFHKYQGESEK